MFKKFLLGLFIVVNAFSAANVTTIPGATAIQYYFRNYTYANLALDLPILSMGLATDLNKLVYRNSIGNMYKIMVDASGSSNTPQNRIFYADVNGSATSSTNLTFDGTDLYVNSGTGGSITIGRVTGTDGVFSDSLKAVFGTYSGRLTATDLQLSDSLKAGTGSFSNITSGMIPYQNSTGTLVNSPIFSNGTHIAIGKSIIENWSSSYRALQIGGNTSIFAALNEVSNGSSGYTNNCYNDGSWKSMVDGDASIISNSGNSFAFFYNGGLTADVAFSPTSRFSWTLSGGLNVSNKIVTGDSVVAVNGKYSGRVTATDFEASDTVKGKQLITDSLKLGSGSFLKTYLDTTFYDSLYDNTTYRDRVVARIVQIGRVVMLYQPILVGTVSSSTVYLKGIPSKFLPINTINVTCPLQDSTTITPRVGYIEYLGSPGFQLFRDKGAPLATGSFVGIKETCISWIQ